MHLEIRPVAEHARRPPSREASAGFAVTRTWSTVHLPYFTSAAQNWAPVMPRNSPLVTPATDKRKRGSAWQLALAGASGWYRRSAPEISGGLNNLG